MWCQWWSRGTIGEAGQLDVSGVGIGWAQYEGVSVVGGSDWPRQICTESLVVFCSVTEVGVQIWAEQRRWLGGVTSVAELEVSGNVKIHAHPVVFLEGSFSGLEGPTGVIEVMLIYLTENFWYQVLW
jgi:hypothetical protein